MGNIIEELLVRKMNIRKLILWIFAIFLMAMTTRIVLAVTDAVVAVATYTVENPTAWIPVKKQ